MKNILILPVIILLSFQSTLWAQNPPTGFATTTVSSQWNEAVGLVFTQDGADMFVWERGGKVWTVINDQKQLLIDLTEEVGSWSDHGLLGFALHPDFVQNGYFYMFYLVDRHHLIYYGTPSYNPTTNDYESATIGRVTRYKAVKGASGYTVDATSRKVLVGATKSTGVPCLWLSHVTGSIIFGSDHTLLVSTGDGGGSFYDYGNGYTTYYEQALADNIITPTENVGNFRSQVVNSLSGKILRIDAETGQGIPGNPFYNAASPDAPSSKVWALGFRQPFRMTLKPGTGSHTPSDGNPGIIYVGDVGYDTWEETDVVDKPGLNFGWPLYEGMELFDFYNTISVPNLSAPNPLYNVNGCTQQYFSFQSLIKQQTPDGTAIFPNPCNPTQNIPSTIKTFVHTRPIIDWKQDVGPSRSSTFDGQIATVTNIGAPGSPVIGPQFGGSASVGGTFYTGTDFPVEYQNSYFFGDYGGGWIRNLSVNQVDKPVEVRNFVDNNVVPVYFITRPTQEGLYFINFPSEIRKIYYSANRPPVAVASADKLFGNSPLTIQFTGSNSTDPEGLPLTYEWNFGDGSALSTSSNPSHTFTTLTTTPTQFTITLKVKDNLNVQNQTTFSISVNNTPPQVVIQSPVNGTFYPINASTIYSLKALVTDQEQSLSQLTFQWQTFLHHENHIHPSPIDVSQQTTTTISGFGCDGETYYYVIRLTVTDPVGAFTIKEVNLYPDCSSVNKITPVITWVNPPSILAGTPLSATQLNATATDHGTVVVGVFTYTPPTGTLLGVGASQQLSASFAPGNTTLYNAASKTVSIDVISTTARTFYRAINLNGAALTIDGNNFIASGGAPNFSFTTNAGSFADQTVPLVPATDVNRATMIRSSVYGNTVTATLAAVPLGSYEIYIYVWEDNFTQTYSISLEGSVVVTNYISGGAGAWSRLGPFIKTISDGTISISTSGEHANLSGIEVWNAGQSTTDLPPIVSNIIPDQNAMQGTSFSYTFPTNTFTDPDAGSVLTYTSILNTGSALPSWLLFNPSTRTFSGTPALANVGTLNIQVTASDGLGGIVSDVFALTVNQSSRTFYRAINLNGAALTIDGNNFVASAGAPNFSFTTNVTSFADQTVPLVPATDVNRGTMIRSSVYGNTVTVTLSAVAVGSYEVYIYVWEDNFTQTYSISLEGSVVVANYISGGAGVWSKLGPFIKTISDGTISIATSGEHANLSGIEVWNAGQSTTNLPPIVSNMIPDQNATQGTSFSYTFPVNTFTDSDAGAVLTYTSILNIGSALPSWIVFNPSTRTFSGTPVLANVGTLNIQVTASDGLGGIVSDVFALIVSSSVTKVTPVITWVNPSPITVGTALSATQLNATATDIGNVVVGVYTYTPPSGTLLNVGLAQPLSVTFVPGNTTVYNVVSKTVSIDVSSTTARTFYRAINLNGTTITIDGNNFIASASAPNFSFTTNVATFADQTVPLVPATDVNRATMIRSSVYGNTVTSTLSAVPLGSYEVYIYVWEDNFTQTYSISLEGSVVDANYISGGAGAWSRLGPFIKTISDGTISISTSGGHANLSGIEVWNSSGTSSARVTGQEQDEILSKIDELNIMTVYPNPASEIATISFVPKYSEQTRLTVFDMKGSKSQIVFDGKAVAGERQAHEIEISNFPEAILIIQLINGRLVKTSKLQVMHK